MQNPQVFYVPGQGFIIDALTDNNTGRYSKKTLTETQEEYPGVEIMSIDEASKQIDTLSRRPVTEIDESTYWQMLEVLPPEDFSQTKAGTSFKMAEKECGSITGIYATIGERYFCLADDYTLHHLGIMQRVREYIASA